MSDVIPTTTAGMAGGGLNTGNGTVVVKLGKGPPLMIEINQFWVRDATGRRGLHTRPGQLTIYCRNPTKPVQKLVYGAPQKPLWEKKTRNCQFNFSV